MLKRYIHKITKAAISSYLKSYDINDDIDVVIDYTPSFKQGDYACPTPLKLARTLKKNPIEIANEIASLIDSDKFDDISVAAPGFINFKILKSTINYEINSIISTPKYGSNTAPIKQKILLEYVSANPTGPLHIGHGRWAAIGDTLCNLLKYVGHNACSEFYINDAGSQIDKLNKSVEAAKNNEPIPEDGYHGDYIYDIANESKNNNEEPKDIILKSQQSLLENFKVVFDNWFSEKSLRDSDAIDKCLDYLKDEDYLYEKDDALWFKSSSFGDDKDRVIKKSDDALTYFAVDIAYHKTKVDRGYDLLINIFGADHHGYVPRITSAVNILSKGKTKIDIVIGQLVRLFRGNEPVKMSKRSGDIISLEDVMNEIGVDSTRYFLIMRSTNSTLDFDIELAKKQDNDNPLYYAQYAYARICGIFKQLKEKNLSYNSEITFDISKIENSVTLALVKLLMRAPDELLDISKTYEVHKLTSYLNEISAAFHRFYHENTVLDDNDDIRNTRLKLAQATRNILGILFDIIGITKLESMV